MAKLSPDIQAVVTAGSDNAFAAGLATMRADGAKSGNKQVTGTFNGVADVLAAMGSTLKAGHGPDAATLKAQMKAVATQNGTAACQQ